MIAAGGNDLVCLDGTTGREVWKHRGEGPIVSSPAVGDLNGDGSFDVVFGEGKSVVCLAVQDGKRIWRHSTNGFVYSSPALGSRRRGAPYRREWPMYRHDPQRTGFYGPGPGPLAVYVGSDDGFLHLLDGRTGKRIDRFPVKFPDLIIQEGNHGALKFLSSPSVADLDGNGTLEAVFTLVDRVWCVEDLGSGAGPGSEDDLRIPPSVRIETAKKNEGAPRNAFTLAQVVHSGGWNPPVPVPARLLEELARRTKLEVRARMEPVSLRDDDITRYPFLYITGHGEARLSEEEIARLRGHLERGGFLFAEACCNSEAFTRSIRAAAGKLFGDRKPVPLKADHPVFSKVFPVKTVTLRGRAAEPEFEGIEIEGRLAFLFTRQDYACAWSGECCSSGCDSVSPEESFRMMANIVVTALSE